MTKRIRILVVCFILLILAGLLRIQLSYEDTSDHQGRGPPSVLIKGDNQKLAAEIEKRHKLMQVPQLHISLNNDSAHVPKQVLDAMRKAKPVLPNPPQLADKPPSPPPLAAHFTNLTNEQIQSVEKFVFFIGYGRSGHSIVASLMDAHPNMIVADEYYLFDKLTKNKNHRRLSNKLNLFDELYWNSYTCAKSGRRNASSENTKNYHLGVDGMWQGRFNWLKVIGEKTGGATAMLYFNDKDKFKAVYKQLAAMTGVPLYAVHVVRNPYDIAATVALYHASGHPDKYKVAATKEKKFEDVNQLSRAVDIVLRKAEAVSRMKSDSELDLKVIEMHLEDLVTNPKREMMSICKLLEVECSDAYLQACQDKMYPSAARSREVVAWSEELREKISTATKRFNFFSRYSFEGS